MDAGGIEQFLKARNAWEEEHPDGTVLTTGDEVIDPDAPAAEAAAAAEAEDKPAAEADKPADAKPAEVDAPTPAALAKILEDNPDLKTALEASPEAKGAIWSMARQNAKAAPVLEIFPNVEAAKFAQTNANDFVTLKTAFTLADSPEKIASASDLFLEQFKVVDDKGAPVLDAKGNPTYGDDLELFTNHMTTRNISARIDVLKEKITANQFTTEEGKDNAEQALSALEFGLAYLEAGDADELDKPNLDGLTPEQKAWQEREQKKITDEKERLGIKDKQMSKQQVAAAREANRTEYRKQFGGSVGKYLGNYLKQKEEAGVAIPRLLVTMTDKSGLSLFAKTALDRLNDKLESMPTVRSNSATFEMNAINEEGLKARLKYGDDLKDEYLPTIIDDLLREAGVTLKDEADDKIASRDARRADARTEPAGGLPSSPRHMSDEQLMKEAYKNVDTKFPGIDGAQRMQKALMERDRLQSGR